MNKEFVPYNEAFELKQLGFEELCFGRFYYKDVYPMLRPNSDEKELFYEFGQFVRQTEETTLSLTYSQAFRWFRENYKLQTYIDFYHSESYFYKIKSQDGRNIGNTGDIILQGSPLFTRTYKEAELACLRKLIEIVKNK